MKIVAIGGGENGRPGKPYEIKKFDEEIVKFTEKKKPNFLFIGLSQSIKERADSYYDQMKINFSALGCDCDYLKEENIKNYKFIKSQIEKADIIYVGGGNTLRLMNMLRKYKIDRLLTEAMNRDCVMCGVSAGAICWHKFGNSDSRKFTSNSDKLIKVTGLGYIDALFCPHYDVEVSRQEDLKRMMKTTTGVALAFENCSALKIDDDKYEVLKCKGGVKAFKCFYNHGNYIRKELEENGNVNNLISKN